MSQSIRLAVLAGDGIGPEVVAEGLKVLRAAVDGVATVETTDYDLGARRWHATGETLPDSVLAEIREHDAILLGAVGDPGVPSGVLERGLLLRLRFELDHYVNLRPARLYPGVTSPLAAPGEIDFVVVREGTEGPYVGQRRRGAGGDPAGDRHRGQRQHRLRRRAGRPRRLPPRPGPPAPAPDPGAQAQRAHARRSPVAPHGRADRRRVPRGDDRLPARRRGDDLPRHRPGAVRRDRHRQPLRRHRHRPRRRHRRRHRARGVAATSTPTGPRPACSSRSTARRRTSPARASPTRPRPILSVAMLLEHLGLDKAAARVEQAVAADLAERDRRARRTAEVGDAIAARVAG